MPRLNGEKSLRVLLVGPSPPPYGGMALQARQLKRRLEGDGNTVDFFPSNFPFPRPAQWVGRVPALRTFGRAVLILFKLRRRLAAADVVHILAASWLYFFMVVCPGVLTSRWCGKRVVLNYRGGEAARFFRWWGWLINPVFHLASVVTVPSEFLVEAIQTRFHLPVRIVPNLLDLEAFVYRERPAPTHRLLVTRHLEEIYDIETVLRAFRLIQQQYAEASLWIAGTGSQEKSLRGLVSQWNLEKVRFLGHIEHQDLPAICDQRDIYVNASRVDNFPGALLEASGAGLAVVSTDAGGIPYIYQHRRNALLVPVGDAAALAKAVVNVLQDPSLARQLTTEAVNLARSCTWPEVRKSLYAGYGFHAGAAAESCTLASSGREAV